MINTDPILCIGSVLWDIIGRTASHMEHGADVPGRISVIPGGVAMNIAMALKAQGQRPALLSVLGRDKSGDDLITAAKARGLNTDYIYRSDDLPTDRYMAVEGGNGLIAAIADAHSLEKAGPKILRPLMDGRLASPNKPFTGMAVVDGNLTQDLLGQIARLPVFATADLRLAPASPGKAERLTGFLNHNRATLYLNLEEASILCHRKFETTKQAAKELMSRGMYRAVVTHGGRPVALGEKDVVISRQPPQVMVTRVTGAGDVFMASHIAAGRQGLNGVSALDQALEQTAVYISSETPL